MDNYSRRYDSKAAFDADKPSGRPFVATIPDGTGTLVWYRDRNGVESWASFGAVTFRLGISSLGSEAVLS